MTDQRLSDQLRFLCRDRLAYEQLQAMLAAQQEMAEFLLQQQKQQLEAQHQVEIEHFLASLEEEKHQFILLLSYAVRGPLRQVLDMTQLLMHEDLSYQHHDWLYTLGRSANRLVAIFHEAAGDLDLDLPEEIQLRLPMLSGGMPQRKILPPPQILVEEVLIETPSIDTEAETISIIESGTEIISESAAITDQEPEILEPESVPVVEEVTEIISESAAIMDQEPEISEPESIPVVEETLFPILEPGFMENIINIAGRGKPAIEFLLEVISGYLDEAPNHMDIVRTAYTEKNIGQFIRNICCLRSDTEYLGGLEFSHMCRRIEMLLEQEYPLPWHKISIPNLEKCFHQTHAQIKKASEHYASLL